MRPIGLIVYAQAQLGLAPGLVKGRGMQVWLDRAVLIASQPFCRTLEPAHCGGLSLARLP